MRVHVMTAEVVVPQLHPVPETLLELVVSPVGNASRTRTVPLDVLAVALPWLLTVSVYVPVDPWTKLEVCDLMMLRSGAVPVPRRKLPVTVRSAFIVKLQLKMEVPLGQVPPESDHPPYETLLEPVPAGHGVVELPPLHMAYRVGVEPTGYVPLQDVSE